MSSSQKHTYELFKQIPEDARSAITSRETNEALESILQRYALSPETRKVLIDQLLLWLIEPKKENTFSKVIEAKIESVPGELVAELEKDVVAPILNIASRSQESHGTIRASQPHTFSQPPNFPPTPHIPPAVAQTPMGNAQQVGIPRYADGKTTQTKKTDKKPAQNNVSIEEHIQKIKEMKNRPFNTDPYREQLD